MTTELRDDEEGAIQIGPTDQGMVRLIISTKTGLMELDFPPEEAEEMADELKASAEKTRSPR
ncbi:MAG: DUF6324 family protein, partial [Pseudomonadota bacterium]